MLGALTMLGDASDAFLEKTAEGDAAPVIVRVASDRPLKCLSITRAQLRKVNLVGIISFLNQVPDSCIPTYVCPCVRV